MAGCNCVRCNKFINQLIKGRMTESYPLLERAPAHRDPAFIDFLRENNPVLHETEEWIVITNCKYGYPTAFAKVDNPSINFLIGLYGQYEWRVKPINKRTVDRFHIHILVDNAIAPLK